ncbi:SNF2 domain-containing protein CLASSY 3-like [Rhodamnia argentea]|uniref:SNF2 domain-containing protein CLASSY 3-like n=1 Tax=Rhodamnia argentea TaxID=178133 RepID=A0A8B8N298_9MYRT|nr:SNF2 domain-containing protein CLASSY 3-like [Rhodamnia argentea]
MASYSPVSSRTRARTKKEDPYGGSFSNAELGRRKGGSSGAKSFVRDILLLETSGPEAESSGRGARRRVSSFSGGLGGEGSAGDGSREVIVITDSEDDSDEVISVSGSGEEEEESSDHRPLTARRFEPNHVFHECKNIDVVDGVSSDYDEEESTDFESDDSVGGRENGMSGGEEFLSNACSDDDSIRSGEENVFGEQGEGNDGSFKSSYDDRAPIVSEKRTSSVTEDGPEADLSLDYLSSSFESTTEVDDISDEDLVTNVSESLSTEGETSSSSEEYVPGSECEKMRAIKKRKREDRGEMSCLYSTRKTTEELDIECKDDPVVDAGKKEDVERRVSLVIEWLQDDVEEEKEEEAINGEHNIECMDDPGIDEGGSKENVECRVSRVKGWLQVDVEEVKEEETINVERSNAETDCPSNDENGNSRQTEERGSFSLSECQRTREKAETGHGGNNDDEGLQVDEEEEEEEEEGKAEIEFDRVNAGTDVSSINEKGTIREIEERGNFCEPEKEGSNQSREKLTSLIKVFGVDRRTQEKIYGKVEDRKEEDSGMSCSIQQLPKKRKYKDCSGKKAFANRNAEKEQTSATDGTVRNECRGDWESRTRRERGGESRENTLFKLVNCIWGKDEIPQDDIQKERVDKEKQFAGGCAVREERKESTEWFETFGRTASGIKGDCSHNMYEQKKVGEILPRSGEEGVGVHQAQGRKDCRSTSDYEICWERSGKSKELKYFQRLAQKFRDNKDDTGQKEVVWEIPSRTEPQAEVPPLPVKFFWADEKPEPELAPKSEAEKEMDKMWSDMEFCLRAGELGSSRPPKKFSIEGSGSKRFPNGGNPSLFEGICLQPSGNDSVELSHQSGSVLDLIPCNRNKLYPHQLEGFQFMWKNLAGSTDLKELSNSEPKDVGGCIISHAPGTGKTCLTILFLHTYLGLFPNSRPMVIAPASLLLTWEEEFRKWNKKWDTSISFHNLNSLEFSGTENAGAVRMVEANRHLKQCNDVMRMIKVYSWSKSSSILGISYNLYEKLAMPKRIGIKDPAKKPEIQKKDEEMRKILLDLPGVVVLDEGHTPRNERSSIWNLLLKLRTEKRIILSGTPFQNNFLELYNTLCLVRPTTADELPLSLKKFCQARTGRRKRAKTDDINSLVQPHDKAADDAIVNLRSIMAPFVHVHKGSILRENLPGIKECIVVLNLGDRQKKIVENIQRSQCAFEYEFKLSLACIHPSLILSCNAHVHEKPVIGRERQKLEDLKTNTDAGAKTRFLVELIRLSEALGEKVLVFSQYKEPLSLISYQLRSTFQWSTKGKEILHMHGSLDLRERQRLIGEFNNRQSQARVMLASTKACSEGISLIGASRVVLLDVVWNPSVGRQAISRAFRIGQEKVVYTYHLITKGTAECDKFSKQMEKERLSKLFFSLTDKENGERRKSRVVAEDRIMDEMTSSENFKDLFDQILYQPKDSDAVDQIFYQSSV